jgi:hypothetical protein
MHPSEEMEDTDILSRSNSESESESSLIDRNEIEKIAERGPRAIEKRQTEIRLEKQRRHA